MSKSRILLIGWSSEVGLNLLKILDINSLGLNSTTNIDLYLHRKDLVNPDPKKFNTLGINELGNYCFDIIISIAPIWKSYLLIKDLNIVSSGYLLFISSTSVYNKSKQGSNQSKSYYSLFLSGERSIIDFSKKRNLKYCILRPTIIWGINSGSIFNLINFYSRFKVVIKVGTPNGLRQPLYSLDLAKYIFFALKCRIVGIHNITGQRKLSFDEIYNLISNSLYLKVIKLPYLPLKIISKVIDYIFKTCFFDYISRQFTDQVFNHSESFKDVIRNTKDLDEDSIRLINKT
tara:strand:- start:11505 stop:12371 length:867 start_codon:yes stop_codon:yes gene_type:complete